MSNQDEPEAPWTTRSSKLVLDASPWIQVRKEQVRTGSGVEIDDFYRVEAKDFVLVYAEATDGRIVMLRQWRQGPRRFALSFPGGHVEPGEEPGEAGLRELREETGWTAERVEPLGRFSMHSNFHIGWGNFYLARGAVRCGERGAQDVERASVRLVSTEMITRALNDGQIVTVHDALCANLGSSCT
ncbi:NUDIX hydrolase [Maricaulaceae bacterium MS644]